MVEYITYKVDTNVHVHCMVDYMYNELHYTWWITLCMVDYIMYDELHYTWWIALCMVDYMYGGLHVICSCIMVNRLGIKTFENLILL